MIKTYKHLAFHPRIKYYNKNENVYLVIIFYIKVKYL